MNQESENNDVYDSSIMLWNTPKNEEEDIERSRTASNMGDKSQILNNTENISITFIIGKRQKLLFKLKLVYALIL